VDVIRFALEGGTETGEMATIVLVVVELDEDTSGENEDDDEDQKISICSRFLAIS